MSRVPRPLKAVLLPVWNGGHRLAWRLGEYADAIRERRWQRCAICGRTGPMLYRRWVVPERLEAAWGLSPREAEALARKESFDCFACRGKLRARRLAAVLLDLYPVGDPPVPARSLRDWARDAASRRLTIAEVNRIEGVHEAIRGIPGFRTSEFRDDAAPGATVARVRCEDLTRLTYADASFDLVLTSETLEHVPDLAAALAEIRRVLRPGGRHLFTAPVRPHLAATFPRARRHPDGTIEDLAPRVCHPGGDVGYPVFTEFGRDLPDLVRAAGFEVTTHFGPTTEDDLAQVYEARRPAANPGPGDRLHPPE